MSKELLNRIKDKTPAGDDSNINWEDWEGIPITVAELKEILKDFKIKKKTTKSLIFSTKKEAET